MSTEEFLDEWQRRIDEREKKRGRELNSFEIVAIRNELKRELEEKNLCVK